MRRRRCNKRNSIAIILVLFIVLLIILFGGFIYKEYQQNRIYCIASYNRLANGTEMKEIDTESVDKIEDNLAQYLPGIVFWGDSLTARGMPNDFQDTLNAMLLNTINKSIQSLGIFGNYKVEIPIVNMGVGSETSAMIVARSGAEPYLIAEEFHIPSDTSEVDINISMNNGSATPQIKFGHSCTGLESVTIAGVDGVIETDYNNNYTYHRIKSGDETLVEEGTEIVTIGSVKYSNYIPIIYIGTNGGYNDDPQELIRQQQAMVDNSKGPEGRFIIVGIHTGDAFSRNKLEIAMKEYWREHYINLREYFANVDLKDFDIEVTETDRELQSIGSCPASILQSDGLHFTYKGYKMVAKLIYDRMNELGYFNELKDVIGEVVH